MRIMRHHDPLPSNRTEVTQPVHPPRGRPRPPPVPRGNYLNHKQ